MIDVVIAFVIGLWFGALFGVCILALLTTSHKEDEE